MKQLKGDFGRHRPFAPTSLLFNFLVNGNETNAVNNNINKTTC